MKKVAVVFAGYGSQYVGMGKDLYDEYRIMQEFFEEAYNCQNMNFVKLCFASSDQELAQMNNAYQAIFLFGSALFSMLSAMGVEVAAVGGLDIGYFPALYASGAISFPDGLYYLNKLATFYESFLSENKFIAIEISGIDLADLEKSIKKFSKKNIPIHIVIQKGHQDFIVAGSLEPVNDLREYIETNFGTAKIVDTDLTSGLYSNLMQPIYDQIKLYLEKIDVKDAALEFISPSNQKLTIAADLKNDLIEHMLHSYNYLNIIRNLNEYDILIEISAKGDLAENLKKYYPEKEIISFSKAKDIQKIKDLLGDKAKELERVSE